MKFITTWSVPQGTFNAAVARFLETGGVRIPYLAPEDLIFLKQDSWRDKDKLDVQAMQEILEREKSRGDG